MLSSSFVYTSFEFGAGLSSEQIIRTATLMLPSSILAETALASRVSAFNVLGLWFGVAVLLQVKGSSVRFLIIDVRLWLW